jgi:hypothetical protein
MLVVATGHIERYVNSASCLILRLAGCWLIMCLMFETASRALHLFLTLSSSLYKQTLPTRGIYTTGCSAARMDARFKHTNAKTAGFQQGARVLGI